MAGTGPPLLARMSGLGNKEWGLPGTAARNCAGPPHDRILKQGGTDVRYNYIRNNEFVMDWSDCQLVEVKPGVQRGRPVLKGTRMPVDDIVDNWEAGVDEPEIAVNFQLPIDEVKAILSYAANHQDAARPVR